VIVGDDFFVAGSGAVRYLRQQMTFERFQRIEREGVWTDLSPRAKWRLTGADRVRYLNGQITNDVRKATATTAIHACVTDVKGKVVGDVFIHAAPDGAGLILDAEADLREVLGARLERYIVADDVVLEDVTDDWQVWHGIGPVADQSNAAGVAATRLGVPGVDVWLPITEPRPACITETLDDAEVEALRILRGIPRFPMELGQSVFPQEAGLEATAMDYAKGCYIGQEILSRIRTSGKKPRELVRWQAVEGGEGVAAGESLFLSEADVSSVGVITSATVHPVTLQQAGLALVKYGALTADSRLLVGVDVPRIKDRVNISQFVK
jgi:folate-binding protein YgfZ